VRAPILEEISDKRKGNWPQKKDVLTLLLVESEKCALNRYELILILDLVFRHPNMISNVL
jgi:hypothetical protein